MDRPVSRGGLVSLGRHRLLAAEILGGQLVGIRIEPATLMFYDPGSRALLRTRPNPLTSAEVGPPARRPPGRAAATAFRRAHPGPAPRSAPPA